MKILVFYSSKIILSVKVNDIEFICHSTIDNRHKWNNYTVHFLNTNTIYVSITTNNNIFNK